MTETPQPIGEDMIIRVMQYCDGALAPQEAEAVARQIAADPALQILAKDLQSGAEAARSTMATFDNQPVPFALARAVSAGSRSNTQAATSRRSYFLSQIAAALFGVLLGAGALGIWSAGQPEEDGLRLAGAKSGNQANDGTLAIDAVDMSAFRSALISVLNAGPEATTQSVTFGDQTSGQGQVTVVNWFKLAAGTSCAEFKQEQEGGVSNNGVACRRDDSGWEVILLP